MKCECGNETYDDLLWCEWCEPHSHEPPSRSHSFTPNMLCTDCKLLAQDCCDAASECPGYVSRV